MREPIVLIGMRGVGKTTVGKTLAAKLGKPFWDSDEAFELSHKIEIPDYVSRNGLEKFREEEFNILRERPMAGIIATGGGFVEYAPSYELVANGPGTIVCLDCDADIIWGRIKAEPKKIIVGQVTDIADFKVMHQRRLSKYKSMTKNIINCQNLGSEQIAVQIINLLK